ncbi:hypothetical protein JG687_00010594 [Phytophthora cactorum]|uniref:Uncharacterized protein n=1 Tax=Phytophthora cactorum TaxID=29920 RepID=A0A8T1U8L6_9STRA|nr:hypothetical protein JG687_00010594 [Phytophthora cactorum]
MDTRGKPGLDVKIPIHVAYNDGRGRSSQIFTSILNAEKTIKEQWRAYEQSAGNRGVETGAIRCTLELGPMSVEMTDTFGYHSLAPKLQKFVLRDNAWLSKLTLSPGCGDIYDEIHETRENFRQIVTAAFDWERRSPGRASTRLYSDRGVPSRWQPSSDESYGSRRTLV